MKKSLSLLLVLALILVSGFAYSIFSNNEKAQLALGASSGPDQVGSDHYSWNGVVIYPSNFKAVNATTTLCAVKSPSATTTLTKFSINFPTSISTTSAPTVYLARASSPYASTTNLTTYTFAQGASGTVVATSSIQTGGYNVVPPSTWMTVSASGQAAFYDPQATCQAEFTGV